VLTAPLPTPESEDLSLGSRADAWESYARTSGTLLGPQGMGLGASRSAADIASTSRGIRPGWRKRQGASSHWRSHGDEMASSVARRGPQAAPAPSKNDPATLLGQIAIDTGKISGRIPTHAA
jgi:hypothetical protein